MSSAYRILNGKFEWKRLPRKPRSKWDDNIKIKYGVFLTLYSLFIHSGNTTYCRLYSGVSSFEEGLIHKGVDKTYYFTFSME
jgi:hypothetical protein